MHFPIIISEDFSCNFKKLIKRLYFDLYSIFKLKDFLKKFCEHLLLIYGLDFTKHNLKVILNSEGKKVKIVNQS
ncbi:hypothetical protein WKT22_04603 [Candidatus Lokiarchaeum ossiferum]